MHFHPVRLTVEPSLWETAYVRTVRYERRTKQKERRGKWSEGNENGEHGERRPVVVRHRSDRRGATAHLPAGRGFSRCPPGWKSVRRFSCPLTETRACRKYTRTGHIFLFKASSIIFFPRRYFSPLFSNASDTDGRAGNPRFIIFFGYNTRK